MIEFIWLLISTYAITLLHSHCKNWTGAGWVSLSGCCPCYDSGWCLVLTLETSFTVHNAVIVTLRALSLLILVTALQGSCSSKRWGSLTWIFSSPSFTQIISRKNPEDVQEVRHAAFFQSIFWVVNASLPLTTEKYQDKGYCISHPKIMARRYFSFRYFVLLVLIHEFQNLALWLLYTLYPETEA